MIGLKNILWLDMIINSKATAVFYKKEKHTTFISGIDLIKNLDSISEITESNFSKFLIISDSNVFPLYGKELLQSIKKMGIESIVSVIPAGENSKSLDIIPQIITPFFETGFNKNSCLISLGGGVVSDIGGFLSSILLRGIHAINIPTTLLSQIDAALGGKSGVDFKVGNKMYKNMIGVIEQPDFVMTDTSVLFSLPKEEIVNGLGEIVKYWIGFGKPDLKSIHTISNGLTNKNIDLITEIVDECRKIKMDLLVQDPYDNLHIREKLNLGHTLGHAIEGSMNGSLSHGRAIAIGIVAAAKISVLKGLLSKEKYLYIVKSIKEVGLPIGIKSANKELILSLLEMDKKAGSFVLLSDIGNLLTQIHVERSIIKKALSEVDL